MTVVNLQDYQGVQIVDVQPGSPSERAALQPGDTLIHMNGVPIQDAYEVARFVKQCVPEQEILFTLQKQMKIIHRKLKVSINP